MKSGFKMACFDDVEGGRLVECCWSLELGWELLGTNMVNHQVNAIYERHGRLSGRVVNGGIMGTREWVALTWSLTHWDSPARSRYGRWFGVVGLQWICNWRGWAPQVVL